jgi:hypothetical protein
MNAKHGGRIISKASITPTKLLLVPMRRRNEPRTSEVHAIATALEEPLAAYLLDKFAAQRPGETVVLRRGSRKIRADGRTP